MTAGVPDHGLPALRPFVETLPLPPRPFTNPDGHDAHPNLGVFVEQQDGKLREDRVAVKIDWLQSEKSQFSVRYNINDSETTTPYGIGTDQIANGKLRVQFFKVAHNYAFSPNHDQRGGFGINRNLTMLDGAEVTVPRIVSATFWPISALANIGPATIQPAQDRNRGYRFLDTLSLVHGGHSLELGADIG